MNILIGYSMRSGSTLLQHILNEHSQIRSFSDFNSLFVMPLVVLGFRFRTNICMKPLDIFYYGKRNPLLPHFDKFVWITRDPRDAYLSGIEAGPLFLYVFWPPGRREKGIDIGLIRRWKLIYRHYLQDRDRWHLVRYEQLVTQPEKVLGQLFSYLEVPYEKVYPFRKFRRLWAGGDYKIKRTSTVHSKSVGRHKTEMPKSQQRIFENYIGKEMWLLGYQ